VIKQKIPSKWEMMELPHSDMYWPPSEGENKYIKKINLATELVSIL
jgi:hypothetical protein